MVKFCDKTHLSSVDITEFCLSLSAIDSTGTWVAIDNMSMYKFGRDDVLFDQVKHALKHLVLSVSFEPSTKVGQLDSYHWFNSVEKLLETEDEEFATDLYLHLKNLVNLFGPKFQTIS
ncbi:hypothetical protein AKJ18_21820 [Vibrio xuii]|nr:hypothetical protein AKJ18_21820 [Vibrio xuii]